MTAPELQSLLHGCKDAPDDDNPRLVLADWLEEHGEPDRAEFVRLSLRLAADEIPKGEEAPALARLNELSSRNADRWIGGLRDCGDRLSFRRGLLELRADLDQLRAVPSAAPPDALPWLETFSFRYGQQKWIGDLLLTDAVRHFSGLELTSVRLTAPWLQRLGQGLYTPRLRSLRLELSKVGSQPPLGEALARGEGFVGLRSLGLMNDVSDGAVTALAAAPWLENLTSFRGRRCARGLTSLALSPHAPQLTRLHLDYVRLGKAAMQGLVASPLLARVVDLRLAHAELGAGEAAAFAARDWPRLRKLSLQSNPLDDRGMRALAKVEGFSALKWLTLTWTAMDSGALRTLLSCPWVAGLERLELTGSFDDEAAWLIADCAALGGLRHLELQGEAIGTAGVRALLSSRKLASLQTLVLSTGKGCEPSGLADGGLPSLTALSLHADSVTPAGIRALAGASLAARLRHLDLQHCGLTDEAAAALAVPAFAGLTSLDLSYNRSLGPASATALARGPWQNLLRLKIGSCRLQDDGLRELLRPEAFPALAILNVSGNESTLDGIRKHVLDWPRLPQLAQCRPGYYYPPVLNRLAFPVAFPDD